MILIWPMRRFLLRPLVTRLHSSGPGFTSPSDPALAYAFLGGPKFNFSATLVNGQLVCIPPTGNRNLLILPWIFICHLLFISHSPMGSCQLHIFTITYILSFDWFFVTIYCRIAGFHTTSLNFNNDDDLYFALFTLNLHYICRSKL